MFVQVVVAKFCLRFDLETDLCQNKVTATKYFSAAFIKIYG